MLLTLALLVLVSTVLISAAAGFFRQRDGRPDDAFWSAVNAARQLALDQNQPVAMRYDTETKRLLWSAGDANGSAAFAGRTLRFLPPERGSTLLLGGVLIEGDALARVRFYPDGTCDPFRLEIKTEGAAPRLLRIDPWTCAPVLSPARS
ncbi:MAG: GspH/FimT family pseudopilin [Opitutaceae bacterium]|nr:GspH/FimT family pseudopilin [Opitutaceae bacterium]